MVSTVPARRSGADAREAGVRRGPTLAQVWAFAAIALPVLAALRATIVTNDLAYQIRAGELMLRTHHLLRTDPFTFTAFGRPWLDQQWGAQLLFAGVFRAGGWVGLFVARAVLVGLIAAFAWLACRATGVGTKASAWLALAGFLVWAGGAALRPQLLGMVLFALTMWLAFERRRHPAWLWAVPAVTAVWANIHGSFFLAPLLVGLLWIQDRHARRADSGRTLVVALASAAAATLNPFGLRVWSYAAGISTNPAITRLISEWQPPTIRDASGALFFASLVAVAGFLAWRGRRSPWPTLVVLAAFGVVALAAGRGVFWWGIVVPPVIGTLLPEESKADASRSPAHWAIVVVVGALIVASLPVRHVGTRHAPSPALVGNAPVALTAALGRTLRPGARVFAPMPWSSWFELELPGNPVFIDPRIEVFPTAVIDQDLDLVTGRQGWQRILDRWRVGVVVVDPAEEGELIPLISADRAWHRAYADESGAIFVRSVPPAG
jgi:hypothetical protein